MKYINKWTDREIIKYYQNNLLEPTGKIKEVKITKTRIGIEFYAMVEVPEFEEEFKSKQSTIEIEDLITFTDYEIIEGKIQKRATKEYRKFMYKKFGKQYAEDFLYLKI